jgi:hypothetical protein
MSSRQRADAAMNAVAKGKAAHAAGQPITANPYKKPDYSDRGLGAVGYSGGWSLYPFWNMGYNEARNAADAANAEPKTETVTIVSA